MAYRNPYSEYGRTGDEDGYRREALIRALEESETPPMAAHPRTPTRTPQQTREMLSGPGGRTTYAPDADAGGNEYSGPTEPELPTATTRPPAATSSPFDRNRGYDLLDDYSRGYDRRMEGSPSVLGSAGTGASIGGSIVPGAGHVVGGLAGAVGALFAKNAESAMTDFSAENARAIIAKAHQDALGREASPEYIDQIMRGQGWEPGDEWFGEGPLAYVLDQFATHAQQEGAQRAATPAAATPTAATPGGATAGATGGGLPFSGFDFGRAQDPSKSAKDAFAAAAQQAPPMTDTSKAGAEAWFREHIAPKMEAAGYRIYDLQGDKAWVGSREDPEGRVPVDWLINAGGANPQIGWQPESGGGVGGADGEAPADIQAAYNYLKSIAHPGMSRAEMESAVARAFGNVPGFEKAYAGDVVINGRKIDLITNFEGPGAAWSDNLSFVPLHGGGSPAGATVGWTNSGLNLAPGAQLSPALTRSDVQRQIQEEIQRILSGAPPRDALLAELGGQ